jgi:hypothetical protein
LADSIGQNGFGLNYKSLTKTIVVETYQATMAGDRYRSFALALPLLAEPKKAAFILTTAGSVEPTNFTNAFEEV